VAILPDYQGRGLSKPLLSQALRRLWELGHTRAYLTTSAERMVALRLYERFGFSVTA
jgi:GNAT superfamily N-acetyltransferase